MKKDDKPAEEEEELDVLNVSPPPRPSAVSILRQQFKEDSETMKDTLVESIISKNVTSAESFLQISSITRSNSVPMEDIDLTSLGSPLMSMDTKRKRFDFPSMTAMLKDYKKIGLYSKILLVTCHNIPELLKHVESLNKGEPLFSVSDFVGGLASPKSCKSFLINTPPVTDGQTIAFLIDESVEQFKISLFEKDIEIFSTTVSTSKNVQHKTVPIDSERQGPQCLTFSSKCVLLAEVARMAESEDKIDTTIKSKIIGEYNRVLINFVVSGEDIKRRDIFGKPDPFIKMSNWKGGKVCNKDELKGQVFPSTSNPFFNEIYFTLISSEVTKFDLQIMNNNAITAADVLGSVEVSAERSVKGVFPLNTSGEIKFCTFLVPVESLFAFLWIDGGNESELFISTSKPVLIEKKVSEKKLEVVKEEESVEILLNTEQVKEVEVIPVKIVEEAQKIMEIPKKVEEAPKVEVEVKIPVIVEKAPVMEKNVEPLNVSDLLSMQENLSKVTKTFEVMYQDVQKMQEKQNKEINEKSEASLASAERKLVIESPSYLDFIEHQTDCLKFEKEKLQKQIKALSSHLNSNVLKSGRFNMGELFDKVWRDRCSDLDSIVRNQLTVIPAHNTIGIDTKRRASIVSQKDHIFFKLKREFDANEINFQERALALKAYVPKEDNFKGVIDSLKDFNNDPNLEDKREYVKSVLNQPRKLFKDQGRNILNFKEGELGIYDEFFTTSVQNNETIISTTNIVKTVISTTKSVSPSKSIKLPKVEIVEEPEVLISEDRQETDYVMYAGQPIPKIFDISLLCKDREEPIMYTPQTNALVFDELDQKIKEYSNSFDDRLRTSGNKTKLWSNSYLTALTNGNSNWWKKDGEDLDNPFSSLPPYSFTDDLDKVNLMTKEQLPIIHAYPSVQEYLITIKEEAESPFLKKEDIENVLSEENPTESTGLSTFAKKVNMSLENKRRSSVRIHVDHILGTKACTSLSDQEKEDIVSDFLRLRRSSNLPAEEVEAYDNELFKIVSDVNTKKAILCSKAMESDSRTDESLAELIATERATINVLVNELNVQKENRLVAIDKVSTNIKSHASAKVYKSELEHIQNCAPFFMGCSNENGNILDGVELEADVFGNAAVIKSFSLVPDYKSFQTSRSYIKSFWQESGAKIGDVVEDYDAIDLSSISHKSVKEMILSSTLPVVLKISNPDVYYTSLNKSGLALRVSCPLHGKVLRVNVVTEINTFPVDNKVELIYTDSDGKSFVQVLSLTNNTDKWQSLPIYSFDTPNGSGNVGSLVMKLQDASGKEISRFFLQVNRALNVVQYAVINNFNKLYHENHRSDDLIYVENLLQQFAKESNRNEKTISLENILTKNKDGKTNSSSLIDLYEKELIKYNEKHAATDISNKEFEEEIIHYKKVIDELSVKLQRLKVVSEYKSLVGSIEEEQRKKDTIDVPPVIEKVPTPPLVVEKAKNVVKLIKPKNDVQANSEEIDSNKDSNLQQKYDFEEIESSVADDCESLIKYQENEYENLNKEIGDIEQTIAQLAEQIKNVTENYEKLNKSHIFSREFRSKLQNKLRIKSEAVNAAYEGGLMTAEEVYMKSVNERLSKGVGSRQRSNSNASDASKVATRSVIGHSEKAQSNITYNYKFACEEALKKREKGMKYVEQEAQSLIEKPLVVTEEEVKQEKEKLNSIILQRENNLNSINSNKNKLSSFSVCLTKNRDALKLLTQS